MRKFLVSFIVLLALLIILIEPAWCERVAASATLRITLHVPPRPVTEKTPDGHYDGGYTIARNESTKTVFITAD